VRLVKRAPWLLLSGGEKVGMRGFDAVDLSNSGVPLHHAQNRTVTDGPILSILSPAGRGS